MKHKRAESPFLPGKKSARRKAAEPKAPVPERPAVLAALRAMTPRPGEALLEGSTFPLVVPGVTHSLAPEQIQAAREFMNTVMKHGISGYSPNSAKSMRADWRHWMAFCVGEGRQFMPIQFDDLVFFLNSLVAAGYKRASLDHILFTLRLFSQIFKCPSPTDAIEFQWYWRDVCASESLRSAQKQAKGLNFDRVDTLINETNAALASTEPGAAASLSSQAIAARDAAFVAISYQIMARASEMIALRWEDVVFDADDAGGATCVIRQSKTDRDGEGVTKYIQPEGAALLQTWQKLRLATRDLLWPQGQEQLDANPFIFHRVPRYRVLPPRPNAKTAAARWDTALTVREADRILKRAVGEAYSSHSARVGAAQDLTRDGHELPYIMQEGRWSSPAMPARYAENELALRAGEKRRRSLERLRKSAGSSS